MASRPTPPLAAIVRILIGLSAALILAACTITSARPLIAASEGVTPLPDAFALFAYEPGPDGYARSGEAPASFTRVGNHYETAGLPDLKDTLAIRFIPAGDDFLLAATESTAPAMTYGFARYDDNVLTLWLSPDAKTVAALGRARRSAMPKAIKALSGITAHPRTDALTIHSRAALDALADLFDRGRLPMDKPVVAYLSEDPEASPPSRLVQSGNQWIKVP